MRLSRNQVQAFLTHYVSQRILWLQYEANLEHIPWAELAAQAQSLGVSIASMIQVQRPALATDVLSANDVARGQEFLRAKGMHESADTLDDWIGVGRFDFIDLDVDDLMLQDVLDIQMVRRAIERRWIEIDEETTHERRAEAIFQREKLLSGEKDLSNPPDSHGHIHLTPLGATYVKSSLINGEEVVTNKVLAQNARPSLTTLVDILNIKTKPTPRQMAEVRLAVGRQMPHMLPKLAPVRGLRAKPANARQARVKQAPAGPAAAAPAAPPALSPDVSTAVSTGLTNGYHGFKRPASDLLRQALDTQFKDYLRPSAKRTRTDGNDDEYAPKRRAPRKPVKKVKMDEVEEEADEEEDASESSGSLKLKKANEPIFGLPRTEELPAPRGRAQSAFYAFSADKAQLAAVASRAEFALNADRVTGPSATWPDRSKTELLQLQKEYAVAEYKNRASAAQDVERAKFAACADVATYALEATEAGYAVVCGRK